MSINENSRNFNIHEVKTLYNRQNVAYFNLRDASIVLNKSNGGGSLRKHYEASAFLMLEKYGQKILDRSPLSPSHSSIDSLKVSRDDLRLRVTLQPYKQPLHCRVWEFESMQARDLFIDLLCALVLANGRAYRVFSNLTRSSRLTVEQARDGLIALGVDPTILFDRPISNSGPGSGVPECGTSTSPKSATSLQKPPVPSINTQDIQGRDSHPGSPNNHFGNAPAKTPTASLPPPKQPAPKRPSSHTSPMHATNDVCTCTPPPGISKTQLAAFRLTHPHDIALSIVAPQGQGEEKTGFGGMAPTPRGSVAPPPLPADVMAKRGSVVVDNTTKDQTYANTANPYASKPIYSTLDQYQYTLNSITSKLPGLASEPGAAPTLHHVLSVTSLHSFNSTGSNTSNTAKHPLDGDYTPEHQHKYTETDAANTTTTTNINNNTATGPTKPPPIPPSPVHRAPTKFQTQHAPTSPTTPASPMNQAPKKPSTAGTTTSTSTQDLLLPSSSVHTTTDSDKSTDSLAKLNTNIPESHISSAGSVTNAEILQPPNRRALLHQMLKYSALLNRNTPLLGSMNADGTPTTSTAAATPQLPPPSDAINSFPLTYNFESFLLLFLDICIMTAELLQISIGGPMVCHVSDKRSVVDAMKVSMIGSIISRAAIPFDMNTNTSKPNSTNVETSRHTPITYSDLRLLDNEALLLTADQAFIEHTEGTYASSQGLMPRSILLSGSLVLSSYRLIFISHDTKTRVETPLCSITSITDDPWTEGYGIGNRSTCFGRMLSIKCKHIFKPIKLVIDGLTLASSLVVLITQLAFCESQEKTFAFTHKFTLPKSLANVPLSREENGWYFYDHAQEFTRQGLHKQHPRFRWCELNATYELSPTYPKLLILPRVFTDEEVQKVAQFRSRARIPAITYRYSKNGATISRCAQPLVGLIGHTCVHDERLIACIREANTANNKLLYILDARPQVAAFGNKIQGKGSENMNRYKNVQLHYLGIDNIHAIRNAYISMMNALQYNDDMERVDETINSVQSLYTSSSKWLGYVSLLIASAMRCCQILIEESTSIVIHCSDGWDRSAQIPALAQLLIDPYYRTKRGFAILIEKDWLSFGHQFSLRYGHASSQVSSQRAPIFLQFLDCVYQIVRQVPNAFEFNENFLLALAYHTTSCRFGTFLYNNEYERNRVNIKERTTSIWTYLCHPTTHNVYGNVMYEMCDKPLVIDCSARRMVIWERLYLSELPHSPQTIEQAYLDTVAANNTSKSTRNSSSSSTTTTTTGTDAAQNTSSQSATTNIHDVLTTLGSPSTACNEIYSGSITQDANTHMQNMILQLLKKCKDNNIDTSDIVSTSHGFLKAEKPCNYTSAEDMKGIQGERELEQSYAHLQLNKQQTSRASIDARTHRQSFQVFTPTNIELPVSTVEEEEVDAGEEED